MIIVLLLILHFLYYNEYHSVFNFFCFLNMFLMFLFPLLCAFLWDRKYSYICHILRHVSTRWISSRQNYGTVYQTARILLKFLPTRKGSNGKSGIAASENIFVSKNVTYLTRIFNFLLKNRIFFPVFQVYSCRNHVLFLNFYSKYLIYINILTKITQKLDFYDEYLKLAVIVFCCADGTYIIWNYPCA